MQNGAQVFRADLLVSMFDEWREIAVVTSPSKLCITLTFLLLFLPYSFDVVYSRTQTIERFNIGNCFDPRSVLLASIDGVVHVFLIGCVK